MTSNAKNQHNYIVKFRRKLFKIRTTHPYGKKALLRFIANSLNKRPTEPLLVKKLVNLGIITTFKPIAFPKEPRLNAFICGVHSDYDENAGGFSLDREIAYHKAVNEAVERFVLLNAKHISGNLRSYKQLMKLNKSAVNPEKFVLFGEAAYAKKIYNLFNEETPVLWIEGKSLLNGRNTYAPAQMVYPFYEIRNGETLVDYCSSAGAACNKRIDDAVRSGLLESIERHTMMCMWLSKSQPIRINISDFSDKEMNIYSSLLKKMGIRVKTYLVPNEFNAFVVLSLGYRQNSKIKVFVGMAAKLSLKKAIVHSMEEILQAQTINGLPNEKVAQLSKLKEEDIQSLVERVSLLTRNSFVKKELSFITSTKKSIDLDKIKQKTTYAKMKTAIIRSGFDPIIFDITPPKIGKLGFNVVKILIPGLQPFDVVHKYLHVGKNSLAYSHCTNLNRTPHPFY